MAARSAFNRLPSSIQNKSRVANRGQNMSGLRSSIGTRPTYSTPNLQQQVPQNQQTNQALSQYNQTAKKNNEHSAQTYRNRTGNTDLRTAGLKSQLNSAAPNTQFEKQRMSRGSQLFNTTGATGTTTAPGAQQRIAADSNIMRAQRAQDYLNRGVTQAIGDDGQVYNLDNTGVWVDLQGREAENQDALFGQSDALERQLAGIAEGDTVKMGDQTFRRGPDGQWLKTGESMNPGWGGFFGDGLTQYMNTPEGGVVVGDSGRQYVKTANGWSALTDVEDQAFADTLDTNYVLAQREAEQQAEAEREALASVPIPEENFVYDEQGNTAYLATDGQWRDTATNALLDQDMMQERALDYQRGIREYSGQIITDDRNNETYTIDEQGRLLDGDGNEVDTQGQNPVQFLKNIQEDAEAYRVEHEAATRRNAAGYRVYEMPPEVQAGFEEFTTWYGSLAKDDKVRELGNTINNITGLDKVEFDLNGPGGEIRMKVGGVDTGPINKGFSQNSSAGIAAQGIADHFGVSYEQGAAILMDLSADAWAQSELPGDFYDTADPESRRLVRELLNHPNLNINHDTGMVVNYATGTTYGNYEDFVKSVMDGTFGSDNAHSSALTESAFMNKDETGLSEDAEMLFDWLHQEGFTLGG